MLRELVMHRLDLLLIFSPIVGQRMNKKVAPFFPSRNPLQDIQPKSGLYLPYHKPFERSEIPLRGFPTPSHYPAQFSSVYQTQVIPILPTQDIPSLALPPFTPSNVLSQSAALATISTQLARAKQHQSSQSNGFPFPIDHHLISLIHYNVYRALISNIDLLGIDNLVHGDCDIEVSSTFYTDRVFNIPSPLHPTTLQKQRKHPAWMDMFPSGRARDNMIRWLGRFDEDALCADVVGEAFVEQIPVPESWVHKPTPVKPPQAVKLSLDAVATKSKSESSSSSNDDDAPIERSGVIVWRDPWDPTAWELTEGFLRKYGFIVEGCDDMLSGTNKWRAMRGEEPLVFEEHWKGMSTAWEGGFVEEI